MSKFLKTRDDLQSQGSLKTILAKYILEEFHKFIKEEPSRNYFLRENQQKNAEIQAILDASNHKLRMYGSAEELAGNLKIYESFPDAFKFFGNHLDPYTADVVIYKSLKGEDYIYKSDVFVILQNMALSVFPGTEKSEEARHSVTTSIKWAQNKLELKRLEFVKFDEKWFDEIEKEMKEAAKVAYQSNTEIEILGKELTSGSFDNYLAKFKSISRGVWNEAVMLQTVEKLYSINPNANYMAEFLLNPVIMNTVQNITEKRPEMFHPNYGSTTTTVRLFEDGNQQFVMKAELFHAIKQAYKDKNDNFLTMSVQEVQEKYGNRVKNVEFIRYPILRAKHRAVPIPEPLSTTTDKFCILAVDAFFDFTKSWIFGIQVFQKCPFSSVAPIFAEIGKVGFLSEEKTPHFVSLKAVDELKIFSAQLIEKMGNFGPSKDVRNAKTDVGFSVQNLKNELNHLGLTTTFPEIQSHAELVYSEVDKKKKEPVLRTCDLFDAIEHCVLICVFERLPNYKKFLHNQKGCHRVYGYKCDACEKENQKIQKTSECVEIENLKKELSKLKTDHEKLVEDSKKETENLQKKIESLEHRNLKLSIENQTNGEKMAQLEIKQENKKYSNPVVACTSNSIQCLICDVQIDTDDVIRCPLCKRRFHQKCAFEWLKEHTQCPACNGDLPKI